MTIEVKLPIADRASSRYIFLHAPQITEALVAGVTNGIGSKLLDQIAYELIDLERHQAQPVYAFDMLLLELTGKGLGVAVLIHNGDGGPEGLLHRRAQVVTPAGGKRYTRSIGIALIPSCPGWWWLEAWQLLPVS